MTDETKRKLNEVLSNVDVIHVQGLLDKHDKFWCVRIFCAQLCVTELWARIRVGTSAVNIGIDNKAVNLVVNMGFTRDLCTYFQQLGRGGRAVGSSSDLAPSKS